MLKKIDSTVGAVILAAGRGTRLGCSDIPKVMLEIGGQPLVSYIVTTLEKIGLFEQRTVLVVGFHAEKVEAYFGRKVVYAQQTEQRGTADAACIGMHILPEEIKTVLVLGGDDSAFYTPETLYSFVKAHRENNVKLSLLTVEVEHPELLGRIVRNADGGVKIIEKEYVTEEQKKIHEVSTGTFCFNRLWFEEIFPNMPKLRKLGEYGLTTVLAMAYEQSEPFHIVKLQNLNEWFGVNTPAELEEARRRKTSSVH